MGTLEDLEFKISRADAFFHAIEKKANKTNTDTVLFSLWNEVIQLASEIAYLYKAERCIGDIALAREMFEIVLYYNYIMKDNSDFRAKCYMYYTYIAELKAARFLKEGTSEYNELISINPSLSFFKDADEDICKHISEIEVIINSAQYDEVRSANKNNKNKKWYSISSGINNIRELSREVNMEAQYLILYDYYCNQTHGMRTIRNSFDKNKSSDRHAGCSAMITNSIIAFIKYYSNKIDIKQEVKEEPADSGFFDRIERDVARKM